MAAAPDAAAAFAKYDRNGNGAIEVEELRAMLKDLGLLEGRSPADAFHWVATQFALADKRTKDGQLDLDEFARFYGKVTAPKLLDALSAELPGEVARAREVFLAYASFGAPRGAARAEELDGARFAKLCKEAGLVGGQLGASEADLMFAKAKPRAARRITFEQFLDVLGMVAAKRGQAVAEVVRQVAAAEGPALAQGTTRAEAVRFHDDTSTYTGVQARRCSSGSEVSCAARAARRRSSVGTAGPSASKACPGRRLSLASVGACTPGAVHSRDALQEAFAAFACFGLGSSPQPGKAGTEMDSKQFVKLCRDAGIIDRRLTATSCDLAFIAKAQPLGARKLSFRQFKAALEQLAAEKGVAKEEIFAQVAACSPKLNSCVTPEAVCPDSGRLVSGGGTPTAAAPGASFSAAWAEPAAAEPLAPAAEAVEEQEPEEQEQEAPEEQAVQAAVAEAAVQDSAQEEATLDQAVGKLSLGGGKVFNLTAVAISPRP